MGLNKIIRFPYLLNLPTLKWSSLNSLLKHINESHQGLVIGDAHNDPLWQAEPEYSYSLSRDRTFIWPQGSAWLADPDPRAGTVFQYGSFIALASHCKPGGNCD